MFLQRLKKNLKSSNTHFHKILFISCKMLNAYISKIERTEFTKHNYLTSVDVNLDTGVGE